MAGAVPLAGALATCLPVSAASRIPIAVQLYSVRRECKENFDAAIEQVAAMGFEGVEFAGYYSYAERASDLRKRLEALKLKAAGTHIGLETLRGDALKRTITFTGDWLPVPIVPATARSVRRSKGLADTPARSPRP
jgi:hypothetical protein